MEDIRKKCNPMVDLSNFTSNKKILSKVVALGYNHFVLSVFLSQLKLRSSPPSLYKHNIVYLPIKI